MLHINGEQCVKSFHVRSYSVRMRENSGKMSSRITPNTDTFYAVEDSTDFSKEDIQDLDDQKKIQTATINKDEIILYLHKCIFTLILLFLYCVWSHCLTE